MTEEREIDNCLIMRIKKLKEQMENLVQQVIGSCILAFTKNKKRKQNEQTTYEKAEKYAICQKPDDEQAQLYIIDGYLKGAEEVKVDCDFALEGKDVEIMELKAQIEKMKCCNNCKHRYYMDWKSVCAFNKSEISIEEGSKTVEHFKNMFFESYSLSITGGVIKINPGDELEKGLIKISYDTVSDYETVKAEILAVAGKYFESNIEYALRPFVQIYDERETDEVIYENQFTSRTNCVSADGMIYPYIHGKKSESTPEDNGYFNIFIPKTITLSIKGEAGTEEQQWTVANGYSADLFTVAEGIYNPTLSFSRTKVADKKYNFQGKIELVKYLSSWLELNALFAKYARDGSIELINLQKNAELYPSEYLFPSEDLFPIDYENEDVTSEIINEGEYLKNGLWYEEYYVKPFGKISVNYIDLEENKQTYVYQFNTDAKNIYYMEKNEILENVKMSEADVKLLLDTYFIPNMNDTVYTPVDLQMRGRPDIEAGDYLNIVSKEGNIFTFVMRRTLTGIQHLVDEIEVNGDEVNEDKTDTSLLKEGESS